MSDVLVNRLKYAIRLLLAAARLLRQYELYRTFTCLWNDFFSTKHQIFHSTMSRGKDSIIVMALLLLAVLPSFLVFFPPSLRSFLFATAE